MAVYKAVKNFRQKTSLSPYFNCFFYQSAECGTLRKQLETRVYFICNTAFSIYRQNQNVNFANSVDFRREFAYFFYIFVVNDYAAMKGEENYDAR